MSPHERALNSSPMNCKVVRKFVSLLLLLFLTSCATSGLKTYQCYKGPAQSRDNVATILNQHWGYTWVNVYRDGKRLNSPADITGAAALEITPGIVTVVAEANIVSINRKLRGDEPMKMSFVAEGGRTYFIEAILQEEHARLAIFLRDVTGKTATERQAMMEQHPLAAERVK
ncbi:MAG: hypothetical protein JWM68_440 [Verrucomicrobiales bacterium]|nr:hypothetical protein [Verrucomicrobiales bacterium]